MDCRSVNKEKDLIASDVIYPHYVGESFNVFHNESHRWYYLSDHMPEEVFIFKSYDSYPNVASRKYREVPKKRLLTSGSVPSCVLRSRHE